MNAPTARAQPRLYRNTVMNAPRPELHLTSTLKLLENDDRALLLNMFEMLDIDFYNKGFITLENSTTFRLDDPDIILAHQIFVGVSLCYMPVIIFCNTLVFSGIAFYPGFHDPNNILLLSLCLADFMMGAYCIPMYALSYLQSTREVVLGNKYFCLAWFSSIELAGAGSLISLFLISVDRYIAILCPLKYPTIVTEQRTIRVIVVAWLLIVFVAFLPMMGLNKYDYSVMPLNARCHYYTTLYTEYVVVASFGSIFFIIAVCCVLYAQILMASYRQVKTLRKRSVSSPSMHEWMEHRVSSVRVSTFLMLVFILLWLPYALVAPFKYFRTFSQKKIEIIKVSTQLLFFGNSLVNALINGLYRKENRTVYKNMITTPPWRWREQLRNLHRQRLHKRFSQETSIILSPTLKDVFNQVNKALEHMSTVEVSAPSEVWGEMNEASKNPSKSVFSFSGLLTATNSTYRSESKKMKSSSQSTWIT